MSVYSTRIRFVDRLQVRYARLRIRQPCCAFAIDTFECSKLIKYLSNIYGKFNMYILRASSVNRPISDITIPLPDDSSILRSTCILLANPNPLAQDLTPARQSPMAPLRFTTALMRSQRMSACSDMHRLFRCARMYRDQASCWRGC